MKSEQENCPISKIALLLSDTWTILIIHHLINSPKRFCDLEKLLGGISTRTLTLKLKRLVSEKLIEKNASGLYLTTKKGSGIKLIENAMKRYQKLYLN